MTGRGRPTTGVKVQVRIPADILDDLDFVAGRDEVSRAAVIRGILERWAKGAGK